jgi:dihydroorotate dehydrogenase electron transfer subunit
MFIDQGAEIVRTERWGKYHLLAVKSPRLASQARPGQFLMVRVNGAPFPLLRRPFSIHSREDEVIELFFAEAGTGTAILAERRKGDRLDILGPLGKGFRLGRKTAKVVYLVGGGRGIAPLYFLARELQARGITPRVFYGGKTRDDLPLLRKLKALQVETAASTDDGSLGFPGLVTGLLEAELTRLPRSGRPARLYACGPDPMMKKTAELTAALKIPAEFSLESIMGCGIGACWGCVRKIRRGRQAEWVKICEDGPVFSGDEIVWEEAEKNSGETNTNVNQ